MTLTNRYAVDGMCHAEAGGSNRQCLKPATWRAKLRSDPEWGMGFCDRCKASAWEACNYFAWEKLEPAKTFSLQRRGRPVLRKRSR